MSNPFQGLDEILTTLYARHGGDKKVADLEPDAPERYRQIWQAVGLSDFTRDLGLRARTRATSEDELLPILRGWTEAPKPRAVWGESVEAIRKALPARLRLIQTSAKRIGILDETTKLPDPPVLMVQAESNRVLRWCETYTEWLTERLLGIVAQVRMTGYNQLAALPATQILDEAYPLGMYQLADRIWWMKRPRLNPEVERPTIGDFVFYTSLEAYSAYVFALTDEQRAFMREPPGEVSWLRKPGALDLTKGTPEGFRPMAEVDFSGRPGTGIRAIGRVGSRFVWLGMVAKGDMAVTFNPDAHAEVSSWLEGLGLKVKQNIPLRPWVNGARVGHDYFGW